VLAGVLDINASTKAKIARWTRLGIERVPFSLPARASGGEPLGMLKPHTSCCKCGKPVGRDYQLVSCNH
jgi:hypothetical protein